jgi:hypothetical protein
MTQPTPAPAPVGLRRRALVVAAEGLAVDVGAAVVLAVGPALLGADFAWTRAYWVSIGLLAAKTAVQTGIAYVTSRAAAKP